MFQENAQKKVYKNCKTWKYVWTTNIPQSVLSHIQGSSIGQYFVLIILIILLIVLPPIETIVYLIYFIIASVEKKTSQFICFVLACQNIFCLFQKQNNFVLLFSKTKFFIFQLLCFVYTAWDPQTGDSPSMNLRPSMFHLYRSLFQAYLNAHNLTFLLKKTKK